ncbi:MAG: protein phosphatase CheZ [Hyphomicrobiales bacterium]|nr:protein phosphatase CheZ [Hyphomicrobiales bacterium]
MKAIDALRRDLCLRNADGASKNAQDHTHGNDDSEQIPSSVCEQLAELQRAIDLTKTELATLRLKGTPPASLEDVSNELDAVVSATEGATNEILTSAEQVNAIVQSIRTAGSAEHDASELAEIEDQMLRIFEACNFQDITGQRITKVVNTMKLVETTLDEILKRFGGIDPELMDKVTNASEAKLGCDKALLNGPALDENVKVSQDDIDALFS